MKTDKKKYIIVLLITIGIFIVVFMLVNFLNNKKIDNIDRLQRGITIDLLATETQFALLKNTPCKDINNSVLSKELGELGGKLSFMESNQGADNPDVLQLKKYYSLLQVKDHLLMQELAGKCDIETDSIVYFYEQNCDDCLKQGHVLTKIKEKYPWLRIYSFDRNLEFSIIDTFEGLYDLGNIHPILIIGDETYSGFKNIKEIESYIPELQERKELEMIKEKGIDFLQEQEIFDNVDEFLFQSYKNDELTYTYFVINENGISVKKEVIVLYDSDEEKIYFPEKEKKD